MKTINQLLRDNPGWGDLPVAVYRSDGGLDFVGEAGTAYESKVDLDAMDTDRESDPSKEIPVLVFSAN